MVKSLLLKCTLHNGLLTILVLGKRNLLGWLGFGPTTTLGKDDALVIKQLVAAVDVIFTPQIRKYP